MSLLVFATAVLLVCGAAAGAVRDPAGYVHPLIGSRNGGNTFPGAVVPFGMVQWSPENTKGDHARTAAPGGYQYDAARIRGFSLTHLSGSGCRGASGDIPFLPFAGQVTTSPSLDATDALYASSFSHENETASAGFYKVRLESGVTVELTATARTGLARLSFPAGQPSTVLIRASDSEVGSSDARVSVDSATRTVSGSVDSGNFCGYIHEVDRRSYYTLYFVAKFDRPFSSIGTWEDGSVNPGASTAKGGTTYGAKGYPEPGRGSGAWLTFDARSAAVVHVRVGVSYVSLANAEENLRAESKEGAAFEDVASRARAAWNGELERIEVSGGTAKQLATFYTALYHALLHPNLFSDVNGQYRGFDQATHSVAAPQRAQYANFSGWDVYRSQIPLVTLLRPDVASDVAQSLLNQANQSAGEWDRWTHNSGQTHVMSGDPSAPAVAGIVAFGGKGFAVQAALDSLVRAATVPTVHDLSKEGCEVECVGQRPSLDKWLAIHYIPTVSNSWGGAGETLEDATADFSVGELAGRMGDKETRRVFRSRSAYWKNVFNPAATPGGGLVQNRNEDGTWPALDPSADDGFAEGSSAQYTWMVPFDPQGLFDAMGGRDAANARLDAFFHNADGSWALTKAGGLHAEMDNEPTIKAPWLYDYSGRPDKAQQTIRQIVNTLWSDAPGGIPGNDDLGEMSAWFVWAAMGMYPAVPGRAELALASPLFPRIVVRRGNGVKITVNAPQAESAGVFVQSLRVDGRPTTRPWLPESFVERGGVLDYTLSSTPHAGWGSDPGDAPPSFPAPSR